MMQTNEIPRSHGRECIRAALAIAKFDQVHAGAKVLDNCADLSADEGMVGNVLQESNDRKKFKGLHAIHQWRSVYSSSRSGISTGIPSTTA